MGNHPYRLPELEEERVVLSIFRKIAKEGGGGGGGGEWRFWVMWGAKKRLNLKGGRD